MFGEIQMPADGLFVHVFWHTHHQYTVDSWALSATKAQARAKEREPQLYPRVMRDGRLTAFAARLGHVRATTRPFLVHSAVCCLSARTR